MSFIMNITKETKGECQTFSRFIYVWYLILLTSIEKSENINLLSLVKFSIKYEVYDT